MNDQSNFDGFKLPSEIRPVPVAEITPGYNPAFGVTFAFCPLPSVQLSIWKWTVTVGWVLDEVST